MKMVDRRGQIWVETVIYTLIGLAIIGLVLAVALPKINEKKDEIAIDQAIEALGLIDDKIYEAISGGVGNKRVVNLEIGKGVMIIDMGEDTISWVIDSSFPYSQVDLEVPIGRLNVMTTLGDPWKVELKLSYSMDIMFNDDNFGKHQLDVAPTPYSFAIENKGRNDEGNIVVDLSES